LRRRENTQDGSGAGTEVRVETAGCLVIVEAAFGIRGEGLRGGAECRVYTADGRRITPAVVEQRGQGAEGANGKFRAALSPAPAQDAAAGLHSSAQ
jgi:hypothetical protein